jgi:hypothetical protein
MPQTVIQLSERRLARNKMNRSRSEPKSSPESSGDTSATAGTGILFCLRSLLEEAESAGLQVAAAGLRVAIDAVSREIGDG